MNEPYESLVKQLETYSKELGLYGTVSLSYLINSHRELRRECQENDKETRDEINRRVEEGVKNRLIYNYVDLGTFLDLPLREIINRYYED